MSEPYLHVSESNKATLALVCPIPPNNLTSKRFVCLMLKILVAVAGGPLHEATRSGDFIEGSAGIARTDSRQSSCHFASSNAAQPEPDPVSWSLE